MIVIRLFKILRHSNTCLQTKLGGMFFCKEIAISFKGNVSSGIVQSIGLYGGYNIIDKFLTSYHYEHPPYYFKPFLIPEIDPLN